MLKLAPWLTLPVQPTETPTSFLSRLARKVGIAVHDLAKHCGFRFQQIVDGEPAAIERLASAAGTTGSAFAGAVICQLSDNRMHSIANEIFTRDSLCRARVRICPECIAEDLRGADRELGPFGRIDWIIEPIRVCYRHERLLVTAHMSNTPHHMHDFAFNLQRNLHKLPDLERASIAAAPSDLVRYIKDRIKGVAPSIWFAGLPLYAAAKTAEIVGVMVLHGVHHSWRRVTDSDWHEAGQRGFELLHNGPDAIREFFSGLQRAHAGPDLGWALKATFGRLYEFLSHNSDDPAYDPLRAILREHILETTPVGVGEVVLGEEVKVRRLHSIHSVAVETGLHPKTLRKQLFAAGIAAEESRTLTNDLVLIDALAHQSAIASLTSAMSRRDAASYLNIPRPHDVAILEAGIVPRVVLRGQNGLKSHAFARMDLDGFLGALLRNSTPLNAGESGYFPVGNIAKRTCRTATEVVELVLSGGLKDVRVDPQERGFKSLLVNLLEARTALHPVQTALNLRAVEKRLHTSSAVVAALVELGHLGSRTEVHGVSRLPVRLVEPSDLEEFMTKFVTLQTLALELGRHFRRLKYDLDRLQVSPVFDREIVHATFYRRSQIEPFLGEAAVNRQPLDRPNFILKRAPL